MSEWEFVTDHEWREPDREAVDSVLASMEEFGAGSATSTGLTDEDEPVKSCSVAGVGEYYVAVVVDHRDGTFLWAHRSR